ncbi:hypothetical protein M8542_07180 [Amycolatopsis sp. OK19-0408]|uniref:Uncharacterized protein n=1 Tax=Amycolatopsis iheyensis TaxID=2945988 RepID=A0A9X2NDM3_9PSEU|nr:hypothetical protein [Amycolatopsis iheyensis]MCR6482595.1 hypothetical protein [Amycolatopsis iheyensis]
MGTPTGFTYRLDGRGTVTITHHGRPAGTLRGAAAEKFRTAVDRGDDVQLLLARATGNYKHGNERRARRR